MKPNQGLPGVSEADLRTCTGLNESMASDSSQSALQGPTSSICDVIDSSKSTVSTKRKRGRPWKTTRNVSTNRRNADNDSVSKNGSLNESLPSDSRYSSLEGTSSICDETDSSKLTGSTKRKRGRPRKTPENAIDNTGNADTDSASRSSRLAVDVSCTSQTVTLSQTVETAADAATSRRTSTRVRTPRINFYEETVENERQKKLKRKAYNDEESDEGSVSNKNAHKAPKKRGRKPKRTTAENKGKKRGRKSKTVAEETVVISGSDNEENDEEECVVEEENEESDHDENGDNSNDDDDDDSSADGGNDDGDEWKGTRKPGKKGRKGQKVTSEGTYTCITYYNCLYERSCSHSLLWLPIGHHVININNSLYL